MPVSGGQGIARFPSRNTRHVVLQIKRAEEKSHRRRQLELHGLHIAVVLQHGPADGVGAEVEGDVEADHEQQAQDFESVTAAFTEYLAGDKEHEVSDELGRGIRGRVNFFDPARLDEHPDDQKNPQGQDSEQQDQRPMQLGGCRKGIFRCGMALFCLRHERLRRVITHNTPFFDIWLMIDAQAHLVILQTEGSHGFRGASSHRAARRPRSWRGTSPTQAQVLRR